ncbi:TPA: hypothetical protein DEF17_02305 [bacterium]|nr:MAG: hypothetical protein COS94_09520 [Candidatus Hydrogenedentes bacterium CG07_land_8_20_14_0_80_42_17]HBW46749.1 hypothetical protein [bacterium]
MPKIKSKQFPFKDSFIGKDSIMSIAGVISASHQPYSYDNESTTKSSGMREAKELTPEEEKKVEELKDRDEEVRRHEQAHIAAAGQYVRGGAQYDYKRGPDGNTYAVGGEVKIDTSAEKDPKATIQKMEVVKRAALAPEHPSAQDRRVASEADAVAMKAQRDLAQTISQSEGISQLAALKKANNDTSHKIDLAA